MNISTIEWTVATDEHCLHSGTNWPPPAKLGPQIIGVWVQILNT
jgi:hypothetical protein